MNCCCTNTKNIGCWQTCEDFKTGLKPGVGEFKVLLEFNGQTKVIEKPLEADQEITFTRDEVNSAYCHSFQVLNSAGEIYTLTEDGTTYDCFLFTTKPVIN